MSSSAFDFLPKIDGEAGDVKVSFGPYVCRNFNFTFRYNHVY
jgi:hypothetical protein